MSLFVCYSHQDGLPTTRFRKIDVNNMCWLCLPHATVDHDWVEVAQDLIFVFPPCRRAGSAAVKETSMTDLENKAETTPSTTSPADADKPEVDLLETSETSRFPNYLTILVG